jgi:hypothetical protein
MALLAQACGGFVVYTVTIAICSLAVCFVVHVCGQLEIVMLMLHRFTDIKHEDIKSLNNNNTVALMQSKQMNLGKIVKRHLQALKYSHTKIKKKILLHFKHIKVLLIT